MDFENPSVAFAQDQYYGKLQATYAFIVCSFRRHCLSAIERRHNNVRTKISNAKQTAHKINKRELL